MTVMKMVKQCNSHEGDEEEDDDEVWE